MSWYQDLLGKCSSWLQGFSKPLPPIQRSSAEQSSVESEVAYLTLYEMRACSCCAKVRRHVKWLNIPLPSKDLKRSYIYQKELLSGGGRAQVPCLKIEKPSGTKWLYESDDIIRYLDRRFAPKCKSDVKPKQAA